MKKYSQVFLTYICVLPLASSEIIPGREKKISRWGKKIFAYPFQVVDDATQIDVHKTHHPFCTTKKLPNVTATVAKCFL